jgi:hypothetical protein
MDYISPSNIHAAVPLHELGLKDQQFFLSAKTCWLYQGKQFRFDSPVSLLKCPVLSWPAKIRVANATDNSQGVVKSAEAPASPEKIKVVKRKMAYTPTLVIIANNAATGAEALEYAAGSQK